MRFSYLWLGRLANGLHVVHTRDGTGGTGLFNSLLFLELRLSPAFDDEGARYDRVALSTLRQVPLGDRWRGAITLDGNRVTLTPETGDPRTLEGELP